MMTDKNDNKKNKAIYISGHEGMVGSSIHRVLIRRGYKNIITVRRSDLDLEDQQQVKDFLGLHKPEEVYLCAALVGGIYANNTFPADFIYKNLMIQSNVIHFSMLHSVKKLLFFGSSCIYPANLDRPIREEDLLKGKLEETNEPYAIAKIAGIKMCESYNRQFGTDFRSVMPTNLYGPGDNYHPENSHVIPGLIKRFHESKIKSTKEVSIWGSGSALREFLYVDDLAEASLKLMDIEKKEFNTFISPNQSHINVGYGEDIDIVSLANIIKKIVGYEGKIVFNSKMPNGTERKLLDSRLIKSLGWNPRVNLEDGLIMTYKSYLKESGFI
jgi:GDP-L-fucose synthase